MKIVGLLPLKIHSERIPRKNFKPFAGKPLFVWVLNSMLQSKYIQEIVINTDAHSELLDSGLVADERVRIIERPLRLVGDSVSMNEIIKYDISRVEADHYLMSHVTNPNLTSTSLDSAFESYIAGLDQGFDSLFSVTKTQTRFYDESGEPVNHDPKKLERTQDLPRFLRKIRTYTYSLKKFFLRAGGALGGHQSCIR